MRYIYYGVIFLLATPAGTLARPVSYADGWMFMSMNDHAEYSQMTSYSPSAHHALGVRTDYMREDETWLHTLTYNRLLHRWNQPDGQGNLFLLAGIGAGEDHGDIAPAGTAGMETDWENRRLYISYENRFIASSAIGRGFSQKARVGLAPYIADYDGIHTWLMLQVEHDPSARDNITVTPLVRVFNTAVLGELGISHRKDVMFNIACQF